MNPLSAVAAPGPGAPHPRFRFRAFRNGAVVAALAGCLAVVTACAPSASEPDCRRWATYVFFVSTPPAAVERCLAAWHPGQRDRFGRTALHRAARDAPATTVRLLMAAGWDIEAKDIDDGTPLHDAATENGNHPALRLLLEAGADPNASDVLGRTAIHLAAAGNAGPESILLLIAAGADPAARDGIGWTPLRYATEFNDSVSVARALMEAGG